MFESIVESVNFHGANTPDKLCMVDADNVLTYRDVWERVASCANSLVSRGIGRESYVVVSNNQGTGYVIALLATQLVGANAVPVEKNASLSRNADIVAKVSPSLFIGAKPAAGFEDVPFASFEELLFGEGADPTWDGGFPPADAVSEILFSTGTTGIPKGVVLTHRNDVAMARNVIEGLQMKDDTVEIIPVPLNHSYGLRRTNANLMNGSTIIYCDGVMALKRVFNLMDEYGANAMTLAPNMLSIILKLSGDKLASYADKLDYVQLSSAPVSEQDKNRLMELLPSTRLYNFYGSTESGATCLYDFNAMKGKAHCIGMPIGSARFIVVDDERNPIESSPDNMGILASSGDMVMRGYFKEPELTRETLVDGFVYTKDLGYIDEEGLVYILGRVDDVINFGGIKVAPEEIESAVKTSPIVRDCACVALKDALVGQIPVLFIALEEGAEYDERQFKRFLASVLGMNERPQRIEVIDEIPRTYNGKIARKQLVASLEA